MTSLNRPGTQSTRSVPKLHVSNQRTVPWLLRSQAARRGDHPFLVWAPFDQDPSTITYAEFYQRVLALAAGLRDQGVKRGDFVILHMENCPEFLQAWHACSQLGAVVVTTNTRSSAEEVEYFVQHSSASVAITQPSFVETLRGCDAPLRWIASIDHDAGVTADRRSHSFGEGVIAFHELLLENHDFTPADLDPMDANSVQYTSGTTSRPKGVVWTHANAIFAARSNATACNVQPADIGHAFLPLYHTNALSYSHLSTLWAGATLVLQPRFSASRYWNCVVQQRCTWGIHIPFSLKALFGQPAPENHHFTRWGLGAHEPEILNQFFGIPCIGWFGMTETVALPIYSQLGLPGREMSMGQASTEYEIQIRDDQGGEAGFGESGRLWIRGIPGLTLFHSYLHNREATDKAFDDAGWFDTGDKVTATEDGFITFDGRSGDMLRVGAENVAESEIERVVAAVPGVMEVAVVGRPDPMLDEVPVAFIEAPGAADTASRELIARKVVSQCEAQLADFKVPREVFVVEQIPRVTLGKLNKKLLREQLAAKG